MLTRAAIAALALGGCCAEEWPTNEPHDRHPDTDAAVALAQEALSNAVGVQMPEVTVPITWWWATPEGCLDYESDDICHRGVYLSDCTGAPERIDLAFYRDISLSSLSHELIHHWSHVVLGDSDHQHGGPWWIHVPDMNSAIKASLP